MRRVVLICGPPGSGKTTLARSLGLTVYDRDDPHWRTERQFRAAIARLAVQPNAQAAVIRSGATRLARAQAQKLIGVTETRILLVPPDECRRRIAQRGQRDRVAMPTQMAAAGQWWSRYQPDDGPPARLPTGKRHPTGDPALKSAARKALRELIRRQGRPCEHPHCKYRGHPIDYRPGAGGPLAYELDEIRPRHHGGSPVDPGNVRPTHAGCNRAGGAAITNAIRRTRTTKPRLTLALDNW